MQAHRGARTRLATPLAPRQLDHGALLDPRAGRKVTEVCRNTDLVETAKLADVEPAGTTTLAGTAIAVLFEVVNATLTPPAGAGAEIVIVAVGDAPPMFHQLSGGKSGSGAGSDAPSAGTDDGHCARLADAARMLIVSIRTAKAFVVIDCAPAWPRVAHC